MLSLCQLDDLADGSARVVDLPADAAGKPQSLVLLRSGEAVHAFENVCPHFGVALAKRQEHLIFKPHLSVSCNNHYARFRWSDGYCEFGDCEGESLKPVAVELIDGEVRLRLAPSDA
ncbi:MAG: Rieske 2Fe-2S domain-containing protein [Rhodocyclaceae bacterium]|jgi:nitrite reductase/ring-hydroxylating ferredoxin subunit|nr:Rieske 2Fe-2S domain-containing protein [Rhodocyclaceae bacterium]MBK6906870.1 Rieske 2Fe-2S domain-containing protein [Rhodocyclaceae bacterium]